MAILSPTAFASTTLESTTTIALEAPTIAPAATSTLPYSILSSCVKWVRFRGVPLAMGTNAEDVKPNTTIHKGAVAVFRYRLESHIAYVESFDADGFTISETNYHHGKQDERYVSFLDPFLIGFWEPK